jgi:Cu/Ag efflux protein CusF
MRKSFFSVTVAVVVAAGSISCTQNSSPTAENSASSDRYQEQVLRESLMTVSATVTALDPTTRQVTLREDDGTTLSFRAGPEVRNLEQVQVGDRVKVGYFEATSGRILRPDETPPTGVIEDLAAARAPLGERPGAALRRTLTASATVTAIDPDYPSVTLRDATGVDTTVRVRDKARLSQVKVGDRVVLSFTEAVAVSVDPAN